jgi:hypothetical protein
MIVAWNDWRSNPSCVGDCFSDIYAQRVNALGLTQWTPDGVLLCYAPRDQQDPVLSGDGAGGAIVAWRDGRADTAAVLYVQHVHAAGVLLWDPAGVPLGGGAHVQFFQVAASDQAGGAIIAWMDDRNGNSEVGEFTNLDVFATRVTGSSPLGVAGEPRATVRLLPPRPNPMHAATTIAFVLGSNQRLTAEIFNLAGQRVRILAFSQAYAAGTHTLRWDGRNDPGHPVASGLYVVRLTAAGYSYSRRVMLIR